MRMGGTRGGFGLGYRRFRHSELQNLILHLVGHEGCTSKSVLRKRIEASPPAFYKAVRALIRKGLIKEFKFDNEKIICVDI